MGLREKADDEIQMTMTERAEQLPMLTPKET